MSLPWIYRLRMDAPDAPLALVTVLATEGSAPRGVGTRMVVDHEVSVDTIGGGALEHQAIEQARAILAHPPGSWRIQDYPLGPLLGQCCGGRVHLLIERVDPNWVIENVPAHRARASSDKPGPSCPSSRQTRRGSASVSIGSAPGRLSIP